MDLANEPCPTRPVVIVTGGGGLGIGHGITEILADSGWAVVIVDRGAERSRALADRLISNGATVEVVVADVTDPGVPETCVRVALERFGRLDGLVNNVGVGLTKTAGDVTDEEFFQLFNVDFVASFRFVRAALPELRKSGGAIVNVGSVHAKLNAEKYSLYAATKAALEAFTRGLAVDYGREGVRANIVHPGLVESPQNEALLANLVPDTRAWIADYAEKRQCLPRLTTPRDVGHLTAFLLGKNSRAITGQAIFIDGGTTTLLWNNEN